MSIIVEYSSDFRILAIFANLEVSTVTMRLKYVGLLLLGDYMSNKHFAVDSVSVSVEYD